MKYDVNSWFIHNYWDKIELSNQYGVLIYALSYQEVWWLTSFASLVSTLKS